MKCELSVCGSVSLCSDSVLFTGPDPIYIYVFLALLQALHRTQARWLALETLILLTAEHIGIIMHMYIIASLRFHCMMLIDKMYMEMFIQTEYDYDQMNLI